MKKMLILFFVVFISSTLPAQDYEKYNPAVYSIDNVCLSEEEYKLYQLVMAYRKASGLGTIPLSRSLTYVAQVHVWDLNANMPAVGKCNMHSWSENPLWTGCCYTPDHKKAQCMWDKPGELSSYGGYGYEISFGMSGTTVNASEALSGWQSSSGHNNVILNAGIWNQEWKAIGIGLAGGYAVIWFGNEDDNAEAIQKCK